ncbi:hypothetical protein NDU88_002528 [Pleurodeles waltl]|uniref:Uncharacterized protein n=1 Tax=Pleurodeles waltl TaxID=8319 RepID=A0AAV7UZ46_PLEWA|nr:hypothetical protein NDU88_002528 [Pleurodeles waltl]
MSYMHQGQAHNMLLSPILHRSNNHFIGHRGTQAPWTITGPMLHCSPPLLPSSLLMLVSWPQLQARAAAFQLRSPQGLFMCRPWCRGGTSRYPEGLRSAAAPTYSAPKLQGELGTYKYVQQNRAHF